MVAYSQRKYWWHLWRNRKHMKLQYFISVYILHAEDKADVIHGVPSGLCHHVPHVLGLQRHMNVYDKQIVEIQVPFLFSVEKKTESARAAQVGADFLQHSGCDGAGKGLPEVKLWFLHSIRSEGTALGFRKEDVTVVEPLGRDSGFGTWFDQTLPAGHSQPPSL